MCSTAVSLGPSRYRQDNADTATRSSVCSASPYVHCARSNPLVRYPPLRDVEVHAGAPELLVAATDRGALLARGKLCRGPAIAAPWFNRTGDEPAARVVTSARTCSARVSPKLKR